MRTPLRLAAVLGAAAACATALAGCGSSASSTSRGKQYGLGEQHDVRAGSQPASAPRRAAAASR